MSLAPIPGTRDAGNRRTQQGYHVNYQAGHHKDPYRAFQKEDDNLGKILEIHTGLPGRIHVVLIRQPAGY